MKLVNLARKQKRVVKVTPGPAPARKIAVTPQITYAQMASGRVPTVQQQPTAAAKATLPKAPEAQGDLLTILLQIQGQMGQLQRQLSEQAARVDKIYALLPSLTHLQS